MRQELFTWMSQQYGIEPEDLWQAACRYGLASDGHRAKQRGNQNGSSEHYFRVVCDCEEI